ncbi:hypothetical protein [Candidatus Finniella inopinata]|uniref:DUF4852 domain-containing protein n=1 Tax=Candidatus Finniella inopinata TaxID=1696036 RepID=A0A4Q7DH69_9PROT|nr:hypothetical protein [Candidatus Finniella inopinata]RZI45469.1 hypothetical protein EQU50_06910 [Candidatus Finniella inopinata]
MKKTIAYTIVFFVNAGMASFASCFLESRVDVSPCPKISKTMGMEQVDSSFKKLPSKSFAWFGLKALTVALTSQDVVTPAAAFYSFQGEEGIGQDLANHFSNNSINARYFPALIQFSNYDYSVGQHSLRFYKNKGIYVTLREDIPFSLQFEGVCYYKKRDLYFDMDCCEGTDCSVAANKYVNFLKPIHDPIPGVTLIEVNTQFVSPYEGSGKCSLTDRVRFFLELIERKSDGEIGKDLSAKHIKPIAIKTPNSFYTISSELLPWFKSDTQIIDTIGQSSVPSLPSYAFQGTEEVGQNLANYFSADRHHMDFEKIIQLSNKEHHFGQYSLQLYKEKPIYVSLPEDVLSFENDNSCYYNTRNLYHDLTCCEGGNCEGMTYKNVKFLKPIDKKDERGRDIVLIEVNIGFFKRYEGGSKCSLANKVRFFLKFKKL